MSNDKTANFMDLHRFFGQANRGFQGFTLIIHHEGREGHEGHEEKAVTTDF
jgi:hypothetical protein